MARGHNHGLGKTITSKPKDFKGSLKRLIRQFKPQLPAILFVVFILIVSSALTVISPIFLRDLINGFSSDLKNIALNPVYSGD